MNKKPVWVLTGLAVAAVAVVGGLTKDRWMSGGPQSVASLEVSKAPDPAPQATDQAAGTPAPATPEPAQQTAAAPEPAPSEPAAEAEAPAPADVASQPEPAPEPAATAEQQEPPAAPDQAATTEQQAPTAEEEPAAGEDAPAQQQAAAEPQAPATAETPAPETPAAAEQQAGTAPAEPAEAPAEAAAQPSAGGTGKTDAAAEPEPAPETAPAVTAVEPPATPEPEQVPEFDTVRVEKTGEAVIAGTAEAGAEVVVKLDGKEIGKTVANDSGAFVVVPDNPLPEGSGALTIEAKGKGDLESTPSEQVVAVIVPAQATKQEALVAVVSPGEPTKVLQSPAAAEPEAAQPAGEAPAGQDPAGEEKVAAAQPEPAPETAAKADAPAEPPPAPAVAKPATGKPRMVSLDAVDYDDSGNIVFSGRGQPGLGARIYVDNGFVGDAAVGAEGRWQFSGTANIAPGVHALRIDGIDAKGKVMNRIEVPFFREESQKVVAAATGTADAQSGDQPAAETTDGKQDMAASTPADPAAPQVAAQPKEGRVVIQPGNNLWRISKVLYGSGTNYTVIYEANKEQIRNPDLIYPGQVFTTPNVVPPAETIDPKQREPLVPAAGETAAQ